MNASLLVTLGKHTYHTYRSEIQYPQRLHGAEGLYFRRSVCVERVHSSMDSKADPSTLQFLKTHRNPGAVLLLPFVVSCINLAVPRFYSMFRLVERYEVPRQEVYVLLIR